MADPRRESDRDRPLPRGRRTAPAAVITDARGAASAEMSGRMRRYAITMAFRTACFLSMIWVHGWLRWVLLAGAVLLPYIAVVLANQVDQRTRPGTLQPGGPADAPQLTGGAHAVAGGGEVIEGTVADGWPGEEQREGRVA